MAFPSRHEIINEVPTKTYRILLGVVLAYVLILYLPALSHSFLTWDDRIMVTANPDVTSCDWAGFFTRSPGPIQSFFPLTLASWCLEMKFFGLDARVFHGVNILFHLLNTLLVVLLIARLTRKHRNARAFGLLGGFLFGIHPIHVEPVAWVSGLKDLQYSAFYLLAVLTYQPSGRAFAGGAHRRLWLTFILFLLSLLSKPVAVTLPFVLLGLDGLEHRRLSWRDGAEKIPFFLTSLAFIWKESSVQVFKTQGFSIFSALQSIGGSLVFFLSKMALPLRLSHVYGEYSTLHGEDYALALGLTLFFFWSYLRFKEGRRLILFGVLFFLVNIAPAVKVVQSGNGSLFNDRYLYLSSLGLILASYPSLCAGSLKLRDYGAEWKKVSLCILILVGVFFTGLTYARIPAWHSDETLWEVGSTRYANDPNFYRNLGFHYADLGQFEKAIPYLKKATELEPALLPAHVNLAASYCAVGQFDAGIQKLQWLKQTNPQNAKVFINLAACYFGMSRLAEASVEVEKGLALNPDDLRGLELRGRILHSSH